MITVDANVILRYLLEDVPDMTSEAQRIIEDNEVFLLNEVIAEIIYVLEHVYKIQREIITQTLIKLFQSPNIRTNEGNVLLIALDCFGKKKIDFVDSLLYAFSKIRNHQVFAFDRQLRKFISEGY